MSNEMMIEVSNEWLQDEIESHRLEKEVLKAEISMLRKKIESLEHNMAHEWKSQVSIDFEKINDKLEESRIKIELEDNG